MVSIVASIVSPEVVHTIDRIVALGPKGSRTCSIEREPNPIERGLN